MATRADLELAATAAEQIAHGSKDKKMRERKRHEAELLRARLTEGDFQPGHRIFLNVIGDSSLSDTFTVRGDRRLLLPNLPDITLTGVLDSELSDYLTKQLATYVKNPTVHATGLLRLQFSGAIGKPGFYNVPTDALVSDALMLAGTTQNSDLNKVVVKRASSDVIKHEEYSNALRLGLTLSDLALHPGDEINVGDSSNAGLSNKSVALRAVTALVFPILYIIRRF
jgi:protein involved in polysaccharide export with SLBB domain